MHTDERKLVLSVRDIEDLHRISNPEILAQGIHCLYGLTKREKKPDTLTSAMEALQVYVLTEKYSLPFPHNIDHDLQLFSSVATMVFARIHAPLKK